jgi:hypothetical protein
MAYIYHNNSLCCLSIFSTTTKKSVLAYQQDNYTKISEYDVDVYTPKCDLVDMSNRLIN